MSTKHIQQVLEVKAVILQHCNGKYLSGNNVDYLTTFKVKLVTAKDDDMPSYEKKISSIQLSGGVLQFEVSCSFAVYRVNCILTGMLLFDFNSLD